MKILLAVLLGVILAATSAYSASNGVLISVGKDQGNPSWAKETCDLIHDAVNLSSSGSVTSHCSWLKENEFSNSNVKQELKNNLYLFHIDFRQFSNGNKSLRIINLDPQDDTDIKQFSWNIQSVDQEWKIKVSKLIKQAFDYNSQKEVIKLTLLASGIKDSEVVAQRADGAFIDTLTGEEITGKMAYNIFKDETPKQKHFLRAGLELAGVLGFGAYNYHLHRESMARDWDFPTLKQAWDSKFVSGKAYRYDDNSLTVNETHAYAGMVYYMVARSNGFSSLESFLVNIAASSVWEFIIEYREVVSINDQVLTGIGGFAIGEAYYQIGKIFRKGKNSIVNKVLGTMFDTPSAMNGWLDKHYGNSKEPKYIDTDFWSKIDIETSIVHSSKKVGSDGRATVDAQIINIGSLEQVGKISKILTDTVFSEILYSVPVNQKTAMEDFKFTVKNVLAAYYQKNLTEDTKGNIKGYNFFIGPSSGVDFYETNSLNNKSEKEDWMSVVNVLGSTIRLDMYVSGFKISTTLDLFADFAMVRSYSIDAYKKANPNQTLSSVIANNNYYYGTGLTSAVGVVVSKGRLEFGAKVMDHSYTSINSGYRDSATIAQNLKFRDSKVTAEIYVSYKMTKDLSAKFSYERTERAGGIEGFGLFEGTETRTRGALVYNFR